MIKFWDPFVRVAHWALVFCVLVSWFTGHGGGRLHEWLGYGALAIIALRLGWGFIGSKHARFANFAQSPAATLRYAKRVARKSEPRHLGHNPLGGWMIVALLLAVAGAGISGWLYTAPRFWGDATMERIHEFFANGLIALAILHVCGVIFSSLRHNENLVRAMITGKKRE